MCEIDDASTLTGTLELYGYAPWPRGRTMRACTMPGMRMLWTYVYVPVTWSGMSMRTTGVARLRRELVDVGRDDAARLELARLQQRQLVRRSRGPRLGLGDIRVVAGRDVASDGRCPAGERRPREAEPDDQCAAALDQRLAR